MSEERWECGYCGDCWKESAIVWASAPLRCLKCGETQLLKKLKNKGPGGTNPFGYPVEKEVQRVSYEFED